MIIRYKKFCQIHSNINSMTYMCNMQHLHSYWPNSTEKIFQSGIVDSEFSDHQLIFYTRKVKKLKFHKHSNVLLKSLKHYTVNLFAKGLQKVNFLNYDHFSDIDAAYPDFLNKLM